MSDEHIFRDPDRVEAVIHVFMTLREVEELARPDDERSFSSTEMLEMLKMLRIAKEQGWSQLPPEERLKRVRAYLNLLKE
ncbi:MAG TPA: hypothetical protein VD907_01545 [Verrucomicrobiae bacterium]|nr:hypothetical protein [Verrucomicrobiae bacterium]